QVLPHPQLAARRPLELLAGWELELGAESVKAALKAADLGTGNAQSANGEERTHARTLRFGTQRVVRDEQVHALMVAPARPPGHACTRPLTTAARLVSYAELHRRSPAI